METAQTNTTEYFEDPPKTATEETAGDKIHIVSSLLRRIGAAILLASAVTFILQGWLDWDSFTRYFVFLGFSVVISAVGLFCGLRLKEDKGARTLLGVATAILPAHFLQLGAFNYSLTLDAPASVPQMFLYQAPSIFAALATTLVASAILIPITLAGFSALARVRAKELTITYVLANAMLLIPVRDSGSIAVLAVALYVFAMYADIQVFCRERAMKNFDGRLARLMMFSPLLLLVVRSIVLHSASSILYSVVCAGLSTLLFITARRHTDSAWQAVFESVAASCAASSWVLLSSGLFFNDDGVFYSLTTDYTLPLMIMPLGFLAFALSFVATSLGETLRRGGMLFATAVALSQLYIVGGVGAAMICLLIGITAVIGAFTLENKLLFYLGMLSIGAGLLHHVQSALLLYSMSPWVSLAILGLVVVVGASYLERNARGLLSAAAQFKARPAL
jgi:hypothetical protein